MIADHIQAESTMPPKQNKRKSPRKLKASRAKKTSKKDLLVAMPSDSEEESDSLLTHFSQRFAGDDGDSPGDEGEEATHATQSTQASQARQVSQPKWREPN